jgi:hypothetical protein
MSTAKLTLVLALAFGLTTGLVFASCGGDNAPVQAITFQTDTQQALTKAAFIEEADARCKETDAQISQMVANGQGFTGAGEIADLRQGTLDDIKQLGTPSEDSATLAQFLAAYEKQVQAGQKIALAIQRSQDTTSFESELSKAQSDAQAAATSYGFKECGSPITASSTTGSSGSSTVTPVTPTPSAPVTPPSTGGSTGGSGTGGTGGGVGIP